MPYIPEQYAWQHKVDADLDIERIKHNAGEFTEQQGVTRQQYNRFQRIETIKMIAFSIGFIVVLFLIGLFFTVVVPLR